MLSISNGQSIYVLTNIYYKTYLIVCGLRDVNGKWRHIPGLPGSSKEIHEVVMKVPLKKAHHKNQIIQNI